MLNQSCITPAKASDGQQRPERSLPYPPLEREYQAMTAREKLKRHQSEMAGKVWIPEMWGQEGLLKEWSDCAALDRSLVPKGLLSARRALIADQCRRANSGGLGIENRCS